jgi:hypothetical protein
MEACIEKTEATEDRYGDRHYGDGGSQKMLATTCRGMMRCAISAQRKGHGHRGPDRDSVTREVPKRRTFQKGRRVQLQCNNGIRYRGLKEWLCLGSKGNFNETFRETVRLEITKSGSSVRIWKMSVRTLWRGRLCLKQKKRPLTED